MTEYRYIDVQFVINLHCLAHGKSMDCNSDDTIGLCGL